MIDISEDSQEAHQPLGNKLEPPLAADTALDPLRMTAWVPTLNFRQTIHPANSQGVPFNICQRVEQRYAERGLDGIFTGQERWENLPLSPHSHPSLLCPPAQSPS